MYFDVIVELDLELRRVAYPFICKWDEILHPFASSFTFQPSTNGSIIIHIADKANTKPATDDEHFDTMKKLYLAEINPLSKHQPYSRSISFV